MQNPDDMYAELLEQLDAVEGQLPLAAVSHIKPKDRGLEGDKDKEKQQERERQKEREKAQAAKAQLAARGGLCVLVSCIPCHAVLMVPVLLHLCVSTSCCMHMLEKQASLCGIVAATEACIHPFTLAS